MSLYPEFERLYVSELPAGLIRWLPVRGHDILVQAAGDGVEILPDNAANGRRLRRLPLSRLARLGTRRM